MEPSNMLKHSYLNNCRKIFNKLLETNIGLRDVVLMGDDGKCIKCHRFVLSACSPFFERAFETFTKSKDRSNIGEKELVLVLATYKSENVQRMVDYIYHGELPSDDLSEASDKFIDADFIRLANELKISGLHELLIEKQQKKTKFNHKTPDIIENDEKVILPDKNGVRISDIKIDPKVISPPEEMLKVLAKDDIEPTKQHLPEELVKALARYNYDNLPDKNDVGIDPEMKRPPKEMLKVLAKDKIEPTQHRFPEELLKSLPEYNNWLRLLSNVRQRQAAKNQTLQDKHPLNLLNDIIEGVKYCFLYYPNGEHECLAKIRGHCFSAEGSNQQVARLKCAKTILRKVFNICFDQSFAVSAQSVSTNNIFDDIIESLILDKYRSLMSSNVHYMVYMGYKVIAGIVKSVDNDQTNLKVISIGTGSKFLYEKNLNSNGNAVHDTHAEVVARRGFIRYIYNQIGQCVASNTSNSIFEKTGDANGKFRLKPGIKFHLYVSTAPCGDARVRSHTNGTESISSIIPEGQLRTKGESALTLKKDAKSSANISNVNMSCSAKLLRWNILGIQGAVLSEFIEPIYLTSMVFGEKFNQIHMKRALFSRIETDSIDLPNGFQIIKPELTTVSVTKAESAPYSPNHSVNWNVQGFDVEILESTSGCTMGKDKTKRYSRISKRAMFVEFIKIAKKLNYSHEKKYADAKHNAKDYQMTKTILFQIFENNGLGTWIQKRLRNLDDFTI